MATDAVATLIAGELGQPIAPAALAMAEHCRARHGKAAIAVLFYGSCLRQSEQALADALLDFYVVVDDYGTAFDSRLMALANRLLPPNVFYVELPWQGITLRAKYAVMSLDQFAAGCARSAGNVSIWARFCQPARLVWADSAATQHALAAALADACRTMLWHAWPTETGGKVIEADSLQVWENGFRRTYAAEIRSETGERARALVAADKVRYQQLARMILPELRRSGAAGEGVWRRRGVIGKSLNFLRLVKAAFTFDGAVDYVLWKVRRHSGVVVPVSDWQRRHPLLAAPGLAWKLYRLGAFR
ncbi:hypothetical protein A8950_2531 [Dongia mobilis]|uniref:Phosphatidate cytidylyltransferase n=1 Tax=Dongia mobilis TaxID=578943 RepID=A0A4R6WS70_9PROT|nr:hypothetical protein [Dongia mobilis]TDQ81463.1 hypothetical protein A8950_2531 [Dongia mobilis]